MNHLAHALLAGDDEWLQLGGMLGDFVHGQPDPELFPPRVIAGIRLHRASTRPLLNPLPRGRGGKRKRRPKAALDDGLFDQANYLA